MSALAGLLAASLAAPAGPGCGFHEDGGAWVEALLRADPGHRFDTVLADPRTYRLQILIGEISGGRRPCLVQHGYRVDAEYVYPASAIKLAAAVAALVELQRHQKKHRGLDVDSTFTVQSVSFATPGGSVELGAKPPTQTLRAALRDALVVSSNSAFNWLVDFAGIEAVNRTLWDAGFASVQVRHRLAEGGSPKEAQGIAPPLTALVREREVQLHPKIESTLPPPPAPLPGILVGKLRIEGGARVPGPFDFTGKNSVSLRDLQGILLDVVRPELAGPKGGRLKLSRAHRDVLGAILAELAPPDDPDPEGPMHYKPVLAGAERGWPAGALRSLNKAGRAYGFHLDNAYVEDPRSGRAFAVAVTVYANADGIVGDDGYEYDTVSTPLLRDLGEVLANALLRAPPAAQPAAEPAAEPSNNR